MSKVVNTEKHPKLSLKMPDNFDYDDETKEIILDAIKTAIKPEKNLWAAEIEIYRWVM